MLATMVVSSGPSPFSTVLLLQDPDTIAKTRRVEHKSFKKNFLLCILPPSKDWHFAPR
jgi:hypothetical protein